MKVNVCSVVRLVYDVCTCPWFAGDVDEGCREHRYPQRGAAPRERKPVLNWQVPVTGCVTSPCVISLPVTQFIFASQHLILLLDETLRNDTLSTHQIVLIVIACEKLLVVNGPTCCIGAWNSGQCNIQILNISKEVCLFQDQSPIK